MKIALSVFMCCIAITIVSPFKITLDGQEVTVLQDRNISPLAQILMNNVLAKNVTVSPTSYLGRPALKVAFTEAFQKFYTANNAVVPEHPYFRIPFTRFFYEGIIEVDIAAERNQLADESVRAFAGITFHQQINSAQSETVYLRMTNGRLNNPQPPADRLARAIQYISPPKWEFSDLREQFPGKYEAGADIAEKRWNRLRLVVKNNTVTAYVDNAAKPALQVALLGPNAPGPIALFVDDGTDAYFSNLRITNTKMFF